MYASKPSIFISYRKADALSQASHLYDSLTKVFGDGSVFYDNEQLPPGTDWPSDLHERVSGAIVVLVLIVNRTIWLAVDDEGSRRIDREDDWVRLEVETALKDEQKLVIPLLFNEAKMPSSLPGAILPKLLNKQGYIVREKAWSQDLALLIDQIKVKLKTVDPGAGSGQKGQKEARPPRFSPYHQYTCDRNIQYDRFLQNKKEQTERLHFFYLYGGEMQAHEGLFRRFVGRLKGIDLDYLYPDRKAGFEVRDLAVPVAGVESLSYLRTELPRMLMAGMDISEKDMEAIETKTLGYGLQKSATFSGLGKDDKICIHLTLNELIWDKDIVPGIVRGFIEGFCLKDYPAEGPEVFFFFSIEYEDDNEQIKSEIAETLTEASYLSSLGELSMVKQEDIKNWFVTYRNKWKDPLARKAAMEQYFGASPVEMYMLNVQETLDKIIKQINDSEKDADRNS